MRNNRFTSFVRTLADARSGNITISFALIIVPLMGAAGLAVEFGRVQTLNRQLSAAADIAALGAIAERSPGSIAAGSMNGNGPVPIAAADAKRLVLANLPAGVDRAAIGFDIKVEKTGNKLQADVKLTSNIPATIAQLFGATTLNTGGVSVAEHEIARYMDFYVLLDNSPSMGVGATLSDISSLESRTPETCAFACHQLDKTDSNYAIAKRYGISTRIDVVRQSTQKLTETATASQAVTGQFRMGVYTLGAKAENAKLTTISEPITDLDKVRQYTNAVDLMTVPYDNYFGDQMTNLDSAFDDMNKLIGTPGDGSGVDSRDKILLFVSDGVGDARKPLRCTKVLFGERCQEPLDVRICQPLKDRGIKIAVLYTTYLPIPNSSWYNTWVKPFRSEIKTRMEACATPGLFYEVSPSGGIEAAMKALFMKSIRTVKLSK